MDYERALIYNSGMNKKQQGLTRREKVLLAFIEKYQLKNGASPTVKEMRIAMKLKSDGFAVHCLEALKEKGAIKKGDTPRSVKLLPSVRQRLQADFVKIPVLGNIPAGSPVLSEENVEDWVTFEEGQIKNPAKTFVLKVRGDSMVDAGIFDGDFVVAVTDKKPRIGDIVVALVDGGSTVKRYMEDRGKPYLQAENKAYKNIHPEESLEIQGVVTGVFRWYAKA